MLYRWLLPIVAALAVLLGSVTAYAAAGLVGETECCCPDPELCDCHDHDEPDPDDMLKRCGGEAERVAPEVLVATIAEPVVTDALAEPADLVPEVDPEPEPRHDDIETPPF